MQRLTILLSACLLGVTLLVAGNGEAAAGGGGKCTLDGASVPCAVETEKKLDGKQVAQLGETGPGPGKPSLLQKQISAACSPLTRPKGHPDWQGHKPSEGSLIQCAPSAPIECDAAITGGAGACVVFIPNGETPGAVLIVDPRALAEEARTLLRLETANAHVAPDPDFHTYVHIENWMWLDPGQWGELAQTVSLAGTSVTVTAEPTRVEWDMGPETAICPDGGRAWVDGMSDAAQTTCSYAYDAISEPAGDVHAVSARIAYSITWSCSGVCTVAGGDFGEVLAPAGETTTIEVRQRQTVNTS